MKRFYPFFLAALLSVYQVSGQNYLISFTGTGATATVDSVQVKNLIQQTTLTVNGSDILNLLFNLGIQENKNSHNDFISVWPNPVREKAFVKFQSPGEGEVFITINDITGKPVIESLQSAQKGWNTFSVTGLHSGIYCLNISSADYRFSGKLISIGPGSEMVSISPIQYVKPATLKSANEKQSVVQMQYNEGEQLLLTGYSGSYTTVVPLVPDQSTTLTFNYFDCTDTDGYHYPVVEIGSQVWMAKNLNVGTWIDGSQDQTDNGIHEKYCYNDLESNCDIYGGLYQWNEGMQYVTTEGVQGICPAGWHFSTDEEWTILKTYLGGDDLAGGKMKEAGTTHWASPNKGATNSSGFTALPGGYLWSSENFTDLSYWCYFWSSSESSSSNVLFQLLYFGSENVLSPGANKSYAMPIRCLKD